MLILCLRKASPGLACLFGDVVHLVVQRHRLVDHDLQILGIVNVLYAVPMDGITALY